MPIVATVCVPAAPLTLPVASPRQPATAVDAVAALRAACSDALQAIRGADSVLLLAAGAQPLLHDAAIATLASYGLPDAEVALRTDASLLAAIAARGQAPRVRSERLDGDLAVLALQVAALHPEAAIVPLTVPAGADADALSAIAAGIRAAVADTGASVAVVAAGDLAATLDTTSPGYLVEGADAWDAAAAAAVASTDPTALAALGPADAERVAARGWAPLTVLLAVASSLDAPISSTDYHAPRGVGQLVAR